MKRERFLTAKVYADYLSPDIDLEPAFLGIDMVAPFVPLVPVDGSRSVRPATWTKEYLKVDSLIWPKFEADINIVLTERTLIRNEQLTAGGDIKAGRGVSSNQWIGYSYIQTAPHKTRVALIDTAHMNNPEVTVAHEIGHLLDFQTNHEDAAHCTDDDCIMTTQLDESKKEWEFCADCSEQLSFRYEEQLAAKPSNFIMRRLFSLF